MVSGGSGLVNESECMELLQSQTVARPQSAAPRVQQTPVAAARRHSLAASTLNQTNSGLGVSYSSGGGLTSQSMASLSTANLSLRESAIREQQLQARQRALEARATASQLAAKRRSALMALRLSELVKELQAKGEGRLWQDQVNKLLDAADPKAAIVDALLRST